MSTPIVYCDIQVEVTSWTPPATTSTTGPKAPYTAQATMVVGNNTAGVTITNNVINITVPPSAGPVQLNFNPWTALPTIFTLGAPFKPGIPTGASAAQFSIVLFDRSSLFSPNGAATWTYNGVTYTLAAIPYNGLAVIDLNNPNDSGAGQDYSFNLTLQDSSGNWGVWDPDIDNDY